MIKSLQRSLLETHRRHFGPKDLEGRPVDLVGSVSLGRCVTVQRQHYGSTK